MELDDTIAAVASAPGGAARGVVRLSGSAAREILERCFQATAMPALRDARRATIVPGTLAIRGLSQPLPCDLYWWPNERSYTRQPMAEVHLVGSPPLIEATLDLLCAAGARLARPGEFTLRAFLAGRLDLTQAEAVLGIIDASDRGELDRALAQMAGGLADPLGRLRDALLDVLAHLEAGLDFVEDDIRFISADELDAQLGSAAHATHALLTALGDRAHSSSRARIVLAGCPNVGKSSLFNALVEGPRALVSEIAGTTRDYVTADLSLHGLSCELIDTAGADTAPDDSGLGAAAQSAASQQRRQADVELLCLDATRPLNAWETAELATPAARPRVVAWTKCDAPGEIEEWRAALGLPTSSATGRGLDGLRHRLHESVLAAQSLGGAFVPATAIRCREALRRAAESLAQARELAAGGGGEELVAAELRVGLDALGEVLGAVYTEDVLDRVFSRFCIGK